MLDWSLPSVASDQFHPGTALFALSFFCPFAPVILLLCTVDTADS